MAAVALTPIKEACCAAVMVTALVPCANTSTPVAAPIFNTAPLMLVLFAPMANTVEVSVALPVTVPV